MSASEIVDAGQGGLSVVETCQLAGVSRSTYYHDRNRKPSVRARQDAAIGAEVRAIFAETKKRYGSPRIMRVLRRRGVRVGKKRVARLMRENGLIARYKKRFRVTTNSEHNHPISPNLLKRDFTADAPNNVWIGDITYIWTQEGWMYLATVIDVFSRRVVGWAMRPYLSRQLAIEALQRALDLRSPGQGLIFHSDRGCQYASLDYRRILRSHGIQQSMSRSGNCLDNAMAESFFSSLEFELLMQNNFESRSGALWAVAEYIENFYNRDRLHSGLDYESPVEYEMKQMTAIAA